MECWRAITEPIAARLAELAEIPAIVKTELSEEEAYVYIIETNALKRPFAELLPSEKAAVSALRYENVVCQGKRNDILQEIAKLSGIKKPGTCGHDVNKSRTMENIGEDYGMIGRAMTRYIRLNELMQPCKDLLNIGYLPLVCGVEMSYLSAEEQQMIVDELADNGCRLKLAMAEELHRNVGNLDRKKMSAIFSQGV